MVKCKHCDSTFDNYNKLGTHLRMSSIRCPDGHDDKKYREEVPILYKKECAQNKIDQANKKIKNNTDIITFLKKENNKLNNNIEDEEKNIENYDDELAELDKKNKKNKYDTVLSVKIKKSGDVHIYKK